MCTTNQQAAERAEAERIAAIQEQISAKQNELDGVNSEIEKYQKILNTLTDAQTTLSSYKSTLNTDVNTIIDNYDIKGSGEWSGETADSAETEMTTIKAQETTYNEDVTQYLLIIE